MNGFGRGGSGGCRGRTPRAMGPRAPAAVGAGIGSRARTPVVARLFHVVRTFGAARCMWSIL